MCEKEEEDNEEEEYDEDDDEEEEEEEGVDEEDEDDGRVERKFGLADWANKEFECGLFMSLSLFDLLLTLSVYASPI